MKLDEPIRYQLLKDCHENRRLVGRYKDMKVIRICFISLNEALDHWDRIDGRIADENHDHRVT